MADTPEEIAKHLKLYFIIGALLLVGTALTVALSYYEFSTHAMNITVGLALATVKTALVVLIFMHMNNERPMIYKFMLFAIVFLGVMFSLFIYAHADTLTTPESMAVFEKPSAAHGH